VFNLGILFLFLYNIITSVKSVYVGSLLQHLSPLLVLGISFFIVSVFFSAILVTKKSFSRTLAMLKTSKQNALLLSISTLVGWIAFYYSLKLIEPAIVTGITSASGPLITTLFFAQKTVDSEHTKIDRTFSMLIFIVMLYLVWQTMIGKSSVGEISITSAIYGFLTALICGFANVANTIFSKKLNAEGFGSIQILSFRFIPLMVAVLAAELFINNRIQITSTDLTSVIIIALLGITLPIFIFQEGIRRSTAMIVAYVHATIPIFVLLIQFFDPRLKVTAYSIGGVICISILSLLSIVFKSHKISTKV